jgi:hypothetical protein
MDRQPYSS